MWLSEERIKELGLAAFGHDVLLDDSVVLHGAEQIRLGSHVRIEAGSVLTANPGRLTLGSHVHVSVGSYIFASGADVEVEDFAGMAPRVCIFSESDDYSGGAFTNPTVPDELRNVTVAPVRVGRYVAIGAGSVILPGVHVGEGASVGALTVVHRSVPEGMVVAGNPMRRVGTRDVARLRSLEAELHRRSADDPVRLEVPGAGGTATKQAVSGTGG